jgi:hypothetical protein
MIPVYRLSCGGDKAKAFEPLSIVVDWLITNPEPDWSKQLEKASLIGIEQIWRY